MRLSRKKSKKTCTEKKKALTLQSQTGKPQGGDRMPETNLRTHDSVAQLVEQMTLNHWVVGSSPTGVTRQNGKSPQSTEIS